MLSTNLTRELQQLSRCHYLDQSIVLLNKGSNLREISFAYLLSIDTNLAQCYATQGEESPLTEYINE